MPRRGALQTAAARGRENEFVLLFCGNSAPASQSAGQKPCAAAGVKNTSSCYSSYPLWNMPRQPFAALGWGAGAPGRFLGRKRGGGDSTIFTESCVNRWAVSAAKICPKALGNNRNARVTSWLDSARTDISREQLVGALAYCCLQQFFYTRRAATDRRRASDRET